MEIGFVARAGALMRAYRRCASLTHACMPTTKTIQHTSLVAPFSLPFSQNDAGNGSLKHSESPEKNNSPQNQNKEYLHHQTQKKTRLQVNIPHNDVVAVRGVVNDETLSATLELLGGPAGFPHVPHLTVPFPRREQVPTRRDVQCAVRNGQARPPSDARRGKETDEKRASVETDETPAVSAVRAVS